MRKQEGWCGGGHLSSLRVSPCPPASRVTARSPPNSPGPVSPGRRGVKSMELWSQVHFLQAVCLSGKSVPSLCLLVSSSVKWDVLAPSL